MRLLITTLALIAALAGCGGKSEPGPHAPACTGFSSGTVTPLAADQLVFDSNRGGNHEIYVMRTDGSDPVQLTDDPQYANWWPRISPDRRRILFYRAAANASEDYATASLWVMNADGSNLTRLRAAGENGWTLQGHTEWSPDGTRIAMFGTANAAVEVFVTDACGQNPVQYTRRGGINTDVAWSPDGQQLYFNGCATAAGCGPTNYEIFVMDAVPDAPATQITSNTLADYDPYMSPDGTKLAWLVNVDPAANVIPGLNIPIGRWGIAMMDVAPDGTRSNLRYLIDDGNINSKPAWSRDSQTVFFHRMVPPDYRFRVFRIDVDGSNLTDLTPDASTGSSEYPSN